MPSVDLVNKIKGLREVDKIQVELLSTKEEVTLYPLSVGQQKELMKHSIDGPIGAVSILKELNDIIFQNIASKGTSPLVIDKYPMLLRMRTSSLGNKITISGKTYDISDLPTNIKFNNKELSSSVSYGGITVNVSTPTLEKDNMFMDKAIQHIKSVTTNANKEMITTLFTFEIAKFVDNIVFDGEQLIFADLPIGDCIEVINNLPLKLNQQILSYINKIREKENKLITFSDGVIIPINTLFFVTE